MRVAYADPPYPGQGKRYEHGKEVNHRVLINHLQEYDGWALSTSSPALRDLLPMCPPKTRVAAWCKPWAVFRPNVNPAYCWEPVLFVRSRKVGHFKPATAHDWISCGNIQDGGDLKGAKPPEFCGWLFSILGMEPEDDFHDIFPGTGAVTKAWHQWRHVRSLGGPLFAEAAR